MHAIDPERALRRAARCFNLVIRLLRDRRLCMLMPLIGLGSAVHGLLAVARAGGLLQGPAFAMPADRISAQAVMTS